MDAENESLSDGGQSEENPYLEETAIEESKKESKGSEVKEQKVVKRLGGDGDEERPLGPPMTPVDDESDAPDVEAEPKPVEENVDLHGTSDEVDAESLEKLREQVAAHGQSEEFHGSKGKSSSKKGKQGKGKQKAPRLPDTAMEDPESDDDLCDDLPLELARKAKKELHETKTSRANAMKEFKRLLEDLPPEKFPKILSVYRKKGAIEEEKFLLRFLRARKMNAARAGALIRHYDRFYYRMGLDRVRAKDMQRFLDAGHVLVLPTVDLKHDSRIFVLRWRNLNLKRVSMFELMGLCYYVMEQAIQHDDVQINGVTWIEDCAGLRSGMDFDFQTVKLGLEAFQDGFPARFKGMYLMNEPFYFDWLWGAIRPFMKRKFRERIQILGDGYENITALVGGKPQLPSELGGTLDYDRRAFIRGLVEAEGGQYVPLDLVELSCPVAQFPAAVRNEKVYRFGMEVSLRRKVSVVVRSIQEHSIASALQILPDDTIISINGKDVLAIKDMRLPKKLKDDKVVVVVWRAVGGAASEGAEGDESAEVVEKDVD